MIETNLTLNLSEYEMSVLRGALHEFAEKWPDERGGVDAVLGQIPVDAEALRHFDIELVRYDDSLLPMRIAARTEEEAREAADAHGRSAEFKAYHWRGEVAR